MSENFEIFDRPTFDFEERPTEGTWDADLLRRGCPHPFQSSAFADQYPQLVSTAAYQPRRLYIGSSGTQIGQCLVAISRRKTVQWLYGPVVDAPHMASYGAIVEALLKYLAAQGVRAVDFASTQVAYGNKAPTIGPFPGCYAAETCFVDLDPTIEDILRSCDSSVRKNARKCAEAGVSVEFTSDVSAVPEYLALLSDFRKRLGFPMPPFHPTASSMRRFAGESTAMEIAFARVGGVAVAAMGYVVFGSVVTEIAAAESADYVKLKLPANDLIKISAIERFKKRGTKFYDITGGKKEGISSKEQAIRRFKQKFGKESADYYCIEQRYLTSGSLAHQFQVAALRTTRVVGRLLLPKA